MGIVSLLGKRFHVAKFFKFCATASDLFRMSSYSAVDRQWDKSLSRLCVLEPQPHGANTPDRRKAWASEETEPNLRKCVQVEKALAGPKDA